MSGPSKLAVPVILIVVILSTALAPGLVVGDVPQERAVAVAGALYSGFYLGPEFLVSSPPVPTGADRYQPHVAHSGRHGEYLVVWHNAWAGNRDVYARRVSDAGRLLSWFAVSAGPGDRFQPAAAYNAATDEYLVVWMKDVDGIHHEVWGRLVAWNGSYRGPEFQIFTWPNRAFWRPRVVWNGWRNEYLVVASVYDTYYGRWNDIAGRRVMSDGTTPYPGGAIFQEPLLQPQQADVAYNIAADEYLVVWRNGSGGDIRGARLRGDNASVVAEFWWSSPGAGDRNAPAVATNSQDRYLLVWEEEVSAHSHAIYGKELDVQGMGLGDPFSISQSPYDERNPAVAAKPGGSGGYVVVWERKDSQGQTLQGAHWGPNVALSYFEVAPGLFWENALPTVAWSGPRYLIAYEGDSLGIPTVKREIYGRMWAPSVTYLPTLVRHW